MRHEAVRNAARSSTYKLLGAYLLLATGFAAAAHEEHSLYWVVVFLVAPLLMAPYAAHVVARDRTSGMSDVMGVGPVGEGTVLTSKAVFLGLFALVGVGLTLPITVVLLTGAGTRPVAANLPYMVWAVVLGFAAAAVGMAMGVLVRQASTALTVAFTVVLAWVGLSVSSNLLLGLARSDAATRVVVGLLHLSPLTWAMDAFPIFVHPLISRAPPLWGAGLFVSAWGLMAWGAHRGLRPDGGTSSRREQWQAGSLVLVALGAMIVPLAAWDFEPTPLIIDEVTAESQGGSSVTFDAQGISAVEGYRTRNGEPATIAISVRGVPGETIRIDHVRLESPHARFDPPRSGPFDIMISTTGPSTGSAQFRVPFVPEVDYAGGSAVVNVYIGFEGKTYALEDAIHTEPEPVPVAAAVLTGGSLAGAIFAVAIWGPGRWNRHG